MDPIDVDMRGTVVAISGATSGLGLVTATGLARMGARVVMLNRSAERSDAAISNIAAQTGNHDLHAIQVDLASFESVREACARLTSAHPRIDVLVNNAGGIQREFVLTEDGHELTFQVNHLSPFLLTSLALPALLDAAPGARVVVVSSDALWRTLALPLYDLDMRATWSPFAAYSASKLENVLFARELGRRCEGLGVTANAGHPGSVATNFGSGGWGPGGVMWRVLRPLLRTPEQGADIELWLAASREAGKSSGAYFKDRRPADPGALGSNDGLARQLWKISVEMTGARWPAEVA